jgi:hypothetical protein
LFTYIWLIGCGTVVVFACLLSFWKFVRSRERLIGETRIDHGRLVKIRTRLGIFSFVVLNPALAVALIVGFWLAHQRALEVFVR